MTPNHCLICLDVLEETSEAHARCARQMFDAPGLPELDLDLARLHTVGLAMVGHSSLSGVQRKVSLRLSGPRATLRLEVGTGSYILKPQAQTFPHLPENEHVSLLLAAQCGIEVGASCLIKLKDGTMAFLTRRFDRVADRRKRRQEDFCQLAELPPKAKYEGSAELCFRLVRRYASEPGIDALRLYRLMLFCWWTGNGDAHLKNFSLFANGDGVQRLTPAYDLLSTRLVIPDDPLALPVGGKRAGLTRRSWIELGAYAGLPTKVVARELKNPARQLEAGEALIHRSFLPTGMKGDYCALIRERAALLADEG